MVLRPGLRTIPADAQPLSRNARPRPHLSAPSPPSPLSPSPASPSSPAMRSNAEPAEGVPAFLAKLWKLVDETCTNNLICWGTGGTTFIIKNQIDFARKLLPLYYKHNNMASFVRQLNMYGFHKVVSVENGSLKCENEEIQFTHPCFLRGHPFMLQHIKRKIATSRATTTINNGEDKALLKPELVSKVITDVKQMKGRQESLDARFSVMKRENEALWREVALLRQKHNKQQQIVNNLIQFLMSLVQPSRNGPLKTGVKRRYQLMINDAAHNSSDNFVNRGPKCSRFDSDNELEEDDGDFILPDMLDVDGPIIHEVGEQDHVGDTDDGSDLASESVPSKTTNPASSRSGNRSATATKTMPEAFEMDGDDIDIESLETVETENEYPSELLEASTENASDELEYSIQKESHKGKGRKNSGKKSKKQSVPNSPAFTITSTQASPTLPNNIFDSDEANSQDESVLLSENSQAALSDLVQSTVEADLPSPSDEIDSDFMNKVTSGSYNPNINLYTFTHKGKSKSNKKDKGKDNVVRIKEEIVPEDDEANWNDMTVATLPSDNGRPTYNRFNSVNLRDFSTQHTTDRKTKKLPGSNYSNEDVDDHLLTMQNDIDSLRELLCGDTYSLDANALLGLFEQEEPFYGLSVNPSDLSVDKDKDAQNDSASQLISYVPPTLNLGFEDFEMDADNSQPETDNDMFPTTEESLNTPQVQLSELKFPNDSID
ncbi:heat shock factor [Arctopsyche grandis]|uniref:heat shock factor n=1 Tax=Arctopsyche grandis TaxID=121162 RepID=UPI00406D6DFD